ncbi:MAG: Crp/Fnr family transcriptional regulator [Chloroflexi bacterium]|nr:Crp/Fnr family transcriptional regulator [Chloroflexota bacterium]
MEQILRQISLFGSVPVERLVPLARHTRRRRYAKGQIVFHQGDAPSALYYLVAGKVRVFLATPGGEEATLAILGPGEHFGELGVLDGLPRSASVQALEDANALILERDDLLAFLSGDGAAALAVCISLARWLRAADEHLADVLFLPLAARLARQVLLLAGDGNEARMSQEALAGMVGASRQRVNLVLGEWEREGWVQRRRGSVLLVDVPALQAII